MTREMFERIAAHILNSDLPRKARKLDGLRAAYIKRLDLALVRRPGVGEMLLLDGVAIDTSELENGYWL